MTDIDTVYIVTPDITSPDAAERLAAFGEVAVAAGVVRATLLSVPLTDGQPATTVTAEDRLHASGLAVTIVRLRWFNQNFSEDFLAPAVHAGELRVPAGNGREAFVDADDIAEVVATTLTDPTHTGAEYELTGPRLLSFDEVAAELTAATGRTITYTPLTRERYIQEQMDAGVPEHWASLSAGLYEGIASGTLETTTSDVQKVLGKPARSFREYAKAAARAGAWAVAPS